MSHLYNLLQRFAWWGGNTRHPHTRLIQTACSSAVVHPHPDIYWEEMWPFHYVSSAGVCILVVSPATMMSNVPPPKKMLSATAVSLKCQDGSSFRSIINQACWFPAAVQVRVVSRLLKLVSFIEWNEEEEEELRRVLQTWRSWINRLLVLPVNLQPGSMFIFE